MNEAPAPACSRWARWRVSLLKFWLRVSETLRLTELQATLFWAGVIGFLGALVSVFFRDATGLVHWLFTGFKGGLVESFSRLAWWQRLLLPCLGGALAGVTLRFASRFAARAKSSTDYMEAIVLGNGVISSRVSLVKSLSALFSIASGASIGREGPLVQLSAMVASLIGRIQRISTVRLRLFVACGAAAGIASAYNAPIAGALFVAEIVLRSLAMESFGPLVFASVVATLTTRHFLGSAPVYQITTSPGEAGFGWEMVPYLGLGLLAGLIAPMFLRLLGRSEQLFAKLPGPAFLRLAAGGAVVGLFATVMPEVSGNGYSVVSGILHGAYAWKLLVVILILKILATAATFGSGAVGGVFTPTLFMGACVGNLFAGALGPVWPGQPLPLAEFTLVGMGAFLSATTHAPLMAIIMLFELTLDYQMILPLMSACVVAHYLSRSIEPNSIYAHSLKEKGAGRFALEIAKMPVAGIMRRDPVSVRESARFAEIAERFVDNRFSYLYVVDERGRFRGVISLHDIKSYLNDPNLALLVIARDIERRNFPTITPNASFAEALERFSKHEGERIPVTATDGRLLGSLSKTDLMLALAETARKEEQPEIGR